MTVGNAMALSAWVHARLGKSQEALNRAREADSMLDRARAEARISGNSWSYFWLCRTYLPLAQLPDVERLVSRILEPPAAGAEAHAEFLYGEIAAHPQRSQNEKSEQCYRRAIGLAEQLAMRPLIAHCHIGLARLFGQTGRSDDARKHLETATTMCRDLDMEPWLSAL